MNLWSSFIYENSCQILLLFLYQNDYSGFYTIFQFKSLEWNTSICKKKKKLDKNKYLFAIKTSVFF